MTEKDQVTAITDGSMEKTNSPVKLNGLSSIIDQTQERSSSSSLPKVPAVVKPDVRTTQSEKRILATPFSQCLSMDKENKSPESKKKRFGETENEIVEMAQKEKYSIDPSGYQSEDDDSSPVEYDSNEYDPAESSFERELITRPIKRTDETPESESESDSSHDQIIEKSSTKKVLKPALGNDRPVNEDEAERQQRSGHDKDQVDEVKYSSPIAVPNDMDTGQGRGQPVEQDEEQRVPQLMKVTAETASNTTKGRKVAEKPGKQHVSPTRHMPTRQLRNNFSTTDAPIPQKWVDLLDDNAHCMSLEELTKRSDILLVDEPLFAVEEKEIRENYYDQTKIPEDLPELAMDKKFTCCRSGRQINKYPMFGVYSYALSNLDRSSIADQLSTGQKCILLKTAQQFYEKLYAEYGKQFIPFAGDAIEVVEFGQFKECVCDNVLMSNAGDIYVLCKFTATTRIWHPIQRIRPVAQKVTVTKKLLGDFADEKMAVLNEIEKVVAENQYTAASGTTVAEGKNLIFLECLSTSTRQTKNIRYTGFVFRGSKSLGVWGGGVG